MLLAFAAILLGLIVLVWSSDKFVDNAAFIAENFGVSKLMVGLTVVALGTSAPEILVSAIASYQGAPGLAVGNALGSNIANIGLVLGVTAMVVAIPVHALSAKQDFPIYLCITAVVAWVLADGRLALLDSLVLLSCFVLVIFLVVRFRSKIKDPVLLNDLLDEGTAEIPVSNTKAIVGFVIGLVFLLLSSRLLVWGAVSVAESLGVDELIIGLTIVAIGTSLPELAASLSSALKNHHDLAIGNIVGSNILNLLAVLPLPGLIQASDIQAEIFSRDYLAMLILSLMMAAFIWLPLKSPKVTRIKGLALVLAYFAYMAVLIQASR